MSDLAGILAPVVRDHDYKLRDLEYALELHSYALRPAMAHMRLQRENRAAARLAAKYRAGRADSDWKDRLPGAAAARRHESRAALDQMIKHMQRTRDNLAAGSSAYFRAKDEVHRLMRLAQDA